MFDEIKRDAKYYLFEQHREKLNTSVAIDATTYDRVGGRSSRISKPTERRVMYNLGKRNKEGLELLKEERQKERRWQILITRIEETLSERQRMILTVWRQPKRKGQTRESLCYEMYQITFAHQTMADLMELMIERCAGMYFAMKLN